MSMVTPARPVDVYSTHRSQKRKAYTFGVKYIHLVTETSFGLYTEQVVAT